MVEAAKRAVQLGGVRALYKNAPFLSSVATCGICLGSFDILRSGMLSGREQTLTPFEVGEAGCAAGALSALFEKRCAGFVSRKALEMGLFFGVSIFVRRCCFSEEDASSVPAVLAGGAIGGVVSEGARLSMENLVTAKGASTGFTSPFKGMGPNVMRSLPGTVTFVLTASAIQKLLA